MRNRKAGGPPDEPTYAASAVSRLLPAATARLLSYHEAKVSLQQHPARTALGSRGIQRLVDRAETVDVSPSATIPGDRPAGKPPIWRRGQSGAAGCGVWPDFHDRRIVQSVLGRCREDTCHILASAPNAERRDLVQAFRGLAPAAGEVHADPVATPLGL